MKTKIITTVAVVVIILAGIFLFAKKDGGIQKNSEPIKIGGMFILSGEAAAWGQASQRGAELAVKRVNAEGGINGRQIQMIYEDSQGSAQKAISAYDKLTKLDKVVAIIGPNFQAEISALAPIVSRDNFPLMVPSYAPLSNRPDPRNPLLIWLDAGVETDAIAQYSYDQGLRTMSVIGSEDSWEKEVAEEFARKFKSLGGKILSVDLLPIKEGEIKTTISKSIAGKPEGVFISSYYQFLNSTKNLKKAGYAGKLYSIEVDEYLAGESKNYAEGLQFVSSDSYKDNFRKEFEKTYGAKSNIPAGQSYDAASILFAIMRKTGTSAGDIVKGFKNFKEYDGVSGKIIVTKDNKTIMPIAIFELRDGEIERIKSMH